MANIGAIENVIVGPRIAKESIGKGYIWISHIITDIVAVVASNSLF